MLSESNIEYLKRALFGNRVVLFLGAGFSCDAISEIGMTVPNGKELERILFEFCYGDAIFDETDLQTIFERALKSKKGIKALQSLLISHMSVKSMPDWYRSISSQFWHRIYTTNIDNLVENIYKRPISPVQLDVVVAEKDDYSDCDQYLNKIQYIKLNGSVENDPRTYTFSTRQFARRSTDFDIWYDHFVRDYMTNVTLFVGSNLNEPLFWRHIELRDKRMRGVAESRPRSFLVCPSIPRAKKDNLRDWNIESVEETAEDFFKWINENIGAPDSRRTVLKNSRPDLSEIFKSEHEGIDKKRLSKIEKFYKNFELVQIAPTNQSHRRKSYLLGKAPEWQDFSHNLDAWRDINNKFIEEIESLAAEEDRINVIALLGSAGSGKSTILMRSALNLSSKGYLCYYTSSEELINWEDFNVAIEEINKKVLVFMDDTDWALRWLARIVENGEYLDVKPTFIITSRTNRYERYAGNLLKAAEVKEIETPDLSDDDIKRIINKLSEEDLLGNLRGKTYSQQYREFKVRARKQILVAMREATEGRDFDEIIKNEYSDIVPIGARYLYLCVALCSAEKFKIDLKQIVACSDEDAAATINYISRNLKGLLNKPYPRKDLYETRHSIIANYIVEGVADRNHLKEAYIRLFSVLAHDKGSRSDFGSKMNRLFRRLISHYAIYRRFHSEIQHARDIYESVTKYLNDDHHFWLQFGSMELEYGELDPAANYLAQAEALAPHDNFILTAKGHLKYRQAKEAEDPYEAQVLWEAGRELIKDQINRRPNFSPHAFHIYGSQELSCVRKWKNHIDEEEYREIVKHALDIVENGLKIHYRSRDLRQLGYDLNREYLSTAIPKNKPVPF